MKKLSLQTSPKTALIDAMRLVVFISLSFIASASVSAAQQHEDWQIHRLLHPTAAQRAHEQQGHIFIYDGLRERDVEQAMDQDFDRISSMMFIHVKNTKDDRAVSTDGRGADETDDDGC